MDRLVSMIVNMLLRRGLRSLFAPRRPARTRRDGQPDAEAETARRMRDTQKMMRRLGR